jgi:hypothetical protein
MDIKVSLESLYLKHFRACVRYPLFMRSSIINMLWLIRAGIAALAKILIALALDDLKEDRTDHGLGEDLQE